MSTTALPQPFANSPALDGCHCITSSLAKIYLAYGHPLSEEMLLGLGAGIGFIYWQMKVAGQESVFLGGRGNGKEFYTDLGRRTGVVIREITTSSAAKAEAALLEALQLQKPVMLGGDMGFLPWFDFPMEYHFGGHSFVICGYDGENTLLASDIDQHMSGRKRGLYAPISLEQLRRVRGSVFKPFPPKHLRLEFDFRDYRPPRRKEILFAIAQAADALLDPPIKNMGVSGIRHTAGKIRSWPEIFDDSALRMNLFMIWIALEIGGTGGGCFRAMYARFLEEAAGVAALPELAEVAAELHESARRFTQIALLFQDAQTATGLEGKITQAAEGFEAIAALEDRVWKELARLAAQAGTGSAGERTTSRSQ